MSDVSTSACLKSCAYTVDIYSYNVYAYGFSHCIVNNVPRTCYSRCCMRTTVSYCASGSCSLRLYTVRTNCYTQLAVQLSLLLCLTTVVHHFLLTAVMCVCIVTHRCGETMPVSCVSANGCSIWYRNYVVTSGSFAGVTRHTAITCIALCITSVYIT
jgi:hypothetical protein